MTLRPDDVGESWWLLTLAPDVLAQLLNHAPDADDSARRKALAAERSKRYRARQKVRLRDCRESQSLTA